METDEALLFELLAGLPLEQDVTSNVSTDPAFEEWPANSAWKHRGMSSQSQDMETILALLQRAGVKPPLPADFLDYVGYPNTPDGTPFRAGVGQQDLMRSVLSEALRGLGADGSDAFSSADRLSSGAIRNLFESVLGVRYGENR